MLPVYRGVKHQYGYGLGSIFKTALKTVIPLIKPLVKSEFNAIKKEGLKQGIRAAEDILLRGKNPKKVAISRGKQSIRDLGQQLKSETGINKRKSGKNPHSSFRSRSGKIISKRKKHGRSRVLDIFETLFLKNDAKRFM